MTRCQCGEEHDVPDGGVWFAHPDDVHEVLLHPIVRCRITPRGTVYLLDGSRARELMTAFADHLK